MSDLYDTDTVVWAEIQADLLRRRAAGEIVNDGEIDWPHVAEEIDATAPLPVPQTCPVTLEEMLAPEPGADTA